MGGTQQLKNPQDDEEHEMNPIHGTVPGRFTAVVTDDELARIEGGYMNGMSMPLIVVKILELFRTPPTVPVRTPPSPG